MPEEANHKNLHATEKRATGKQLEKSKLQKAASAFFAEDIDMVKGSIMDDYMAPRIEKARKDGVRKFKEFLFDSLMGIAEIILFGTGKRRDHERSGYYQGQRVNYTRYSEGYSDSRYSRVDDDPMPRASNRVIEYTVPEYKDAKGILADLDSYIQRYKVASVADYYQLVGAKMNSSDYDYGWYDLSGTEVAYDPRSGGYFLRLPRPVPIQD